MPIYCQTKKINALLSIIKWQKITVSIALTVVFLVYLVLTDFLPDHLP